MTSVPQTPKDLRVGHAEREAAVEQLARAHSLGQLEVDEFYERADLALVAKTRADLSALTADLPRPQGSASRRLGPDALRAGRSAVWAKMLLVVVLLMTAFSLVFGADHHEGPPVLPLLLVAGAVLAWRRRRARQVSA